MSDQTVEPEVIVYKIDYVIKIKQEVNIKQGDQLVKEPIVITINGTKMAQSEESAKSVIDKLQQSAKYLGLQNHITISTTEGVLE